MKTIMALILAVSICGCATLQNSLDVSWLDSDRGPGWFDHDRDFDDDPSYRVVPLARFTLKDKPGKRISERFSDGVGVSISRSTDPYPLIAWPGQDGETIDAEPSLPVEEAGQSARSQDGNADAPLAGF